MRRFNGPSFESLVHSGTWATKKTYIEPKKPPIIEISNDFKDEWRRTIVPEVFIYIETPHRQYSATQFNILHSPFSDVDDLAKYMRRDIVGVGEKLKYRPAEKTGISSDISGVSYVNTYCPSPIKAEPGDYGRWEELLDYIITNTNDRYEVKRWLATLIARPAIRMRYGLLMISETQGIGKGTIGDAILTPLVGEHNVSQPSEDQVVDSTFTGWIAQIKLVVIGEIYAGSSTKAYNKLKSLITDPYIRVNEKYVVEYTIENQAQFYVCSNSKRALQFPQDDRRWLVPQLTDIVRPSSYWKQFYTWLNYEGGLQKIAYWAEVFLQTNEPVGTADRAPDSGAKLEMIKENLSRGATDVVELLDITKEEIDQGKLPPDTILIDRDLVQYVSQKTYEGRPNDKMERPFTIRKAAKIAGWYVSDIDCRVPEWGYGMLRVRVISLNKEFTLNPNEYCRKMIPYKRFLSAM
jgi:hypothetical protein